MKKKRSAHGPPVAGYTSFGNRKKTEFKACIAQIGMLTATTTA